MSTRIETFYDTRTSTLTYVVWDPETRDAIVLDPVLDYDPVGSKMYTESVDAVTEFVRGKELHLHYILETHAHADHLSGSQRLKDHFPDAAIGIGEHITQVQALFKKRFNLPASFPVDGSQFDVLLSEGTPLHAGSIEVQTLYTPGHTPACSSYVIDDAVFTGDALFMPDMGTGRCDFPGGSSHDMYDSVQKLYALPDETRVFVGHDYQPGGRDLAYQTTIGEQKRTNVKLDAETSREAFVLARDTRDAELDAPKLIFQSIQVNIDAGHLPPAEDNEVRYLKIPINVFRPASPTGTTIRLGEA